MPKICYFSEICERFEANRAEIGQFFKVPNPNNKVPCRCVKNVRRDSYALFFFYEKKGVQEKIYWRERVVERKIENFSFKNTRPPKKPFPARLSSAARNSA